jgi:putative ATP-binding cassette transporter
VIVAPLVIRGELEFGMMAQAQMAFFLVIAAFSLIVKEFQRISTIGAVIERLGGFYEVLGEEGRGPRKSPIEVVEDGDRVAFEGLTLVTPDDGRPLIVDLTVRVPCGRRLLIVGPSGSGRTSLLRAVAGLWTSGQGRILRPPLGDILFLPQQPYLRCGPLRDQVLYGTRDTGLPDEEIEVALKKVGFGSLLERAGGLDGKADWAHTLSLGEQQRLAFARLLLVNPRFAFLDEATSALDAEAARRLYEVLSATEITYVSMASDDGLSAHHDQVIELGRDGSWSSRVNPLPADFSFPDLSFCDSAGRETINRLTA